MKPNPARLAAAAGPGPAGPAKRRAEEVGSNDAGGKVAKKE